VQKYDIISVKQDASLQGVCQPEKSSLGKETYVGLISDVMPIDEGLPGNDAFGHYTQPSAGLKNIPDLQYGPAWSAHVFHYLSTGYKIITTIPDYGVWGVERVIGVHVVPGFLAHGSQGRARAAAEVQACGRWRNMFLQRLEDPGQKMSISGIIDLVCMFIIAGFFLGCAEMLFRGNKDQFTLWALIIVALTVTVEENDRSVRAQRAAKSGDGG
jgi:hypothetical protein